MLESKFIKSVVNFYIKSFDGNPLKVLRFLLLLIIISLSIPYLISELPEIKTWSDYAKLLFFGFGLPYIVLYKPMMIVSAIQWIIEISLTLMGLIIDAAKS